MFGSERLGDRTLEFDRELVNHPVARLSEESRLCDFIERREFRFGDIVVEVELYAKCPHIRVKTERVNAFYFIGLQCLRDANEGE
ncbi:hypothetical protein [Halococcus sp. AFM35]|uniref:hypothetical protein n=1 Tax=Halococcus sp. AFM35 TaxID=3421653 RepID=UPI003EC12043